MVAYRDVDQGELLGLLERYADAAGELAVPGWTLSRASRAPPA
ncbi:hypothetical protein ACFVT2_21460 [Streptomyces sp. NPDC058000]